MVFTPTDRRVRDVAAERGRELTNLQDRRIDFFDFDEKIVNMIIKIIIEIIERIIINYR